MKALERKGNDFGYYKKGFALVGWDSFGPVQMFCDSLEEAKQLQDEEEYEDSYARVHITPARKFIALDKAEIASKIRVRASYRFTNWEDIWMKRLNISQYDCIELLAVGLFYGWTGVGEQVIYLRYEDETYFYFPKGEEALYKERSFGLEKGDHFRWLKDFNQKPMFDSFDEMMFYFDN